MTQDSDWNAYDEGYSQGIADYLAGVVPGQPALDPGEPIVKIAAFTVSCLPEDHPAARHFTVKIEWRGPGMWAVVDGPHNVGRRLQTAYESNPSARNKRFLNAYRFDLYDALAIAKRYAKQMTINGLTVEQALAGEYR